MAIPSTGANGGARKVKFKSKTIWLLLAAAAVMATVVWWAASSRHGPPQIITLSDGREYRFAGATYGTNHSQPRALAHLVDHLPKSWADYVRAKYGAHWHLAPPARSASPTLCVWFELVGTNATVPTGQPHPPVDEFIAMLANNGGHPAGNPSWAEFGTAPAWLPLKFSEWPRRSSMLDCQIQEHLGYASGNIVRDLGRVKFSNPGSGSFPEWQSEPLPAVKSAGDVHVQLNSLVTRTVSDLTMTRHQTVFSFAITSPQTNEAWIVDDAELSDATGNRLLPQHDATSLTSTGTFSIWEALWSDEAAHRLKLGLKQTSGFPASDLIIVSNLPLSALRGFGQNPSNSEISLTNFVADIPIVVRNYPTQLFFDGGEPRRRYWVEVQPPDASGGLLADIVNVVTDTGEQPVRANSNEPWWIFQSMPAGTKFLNVTVAVQKKRYVEFLAKPTPE